MTKYTSLMILTILGLLLAMGNLAIAPVQTIVCYRTLKARITAYSPYEKGEKKINHRGQRITNSIGCAVPKHSLTDGTMVYIPKIDRSFKVDDRIPARSVRKHERIADKKGIDLDIVLDIRYNNIRGKKALCKKDLGYSDVMIPIWQEVYVNN